jgi:hypothetical protein
MNAPSDIENYDEKGNPRGVAHGSPGRRARRRA